MCIRKYTLRVSRDAPRGVSRAPEEGHVGGRGAGEGAGHVVEGGVTNIQVSSERTLVCFLFNISTRLVGGISGMPKNL